MAPKEEPSALTTVSAIEAAHWPDDPAKQLGKTEMPLVTVETLNDPSAVVLQREALALDGMKGGLPEYMIPNWINNGSITINRVSGVNPEF